MLAPAIPGFRVLRPLGSGGMGQVFLVEPEGLPGAVRALKVLAGHGGAGDAGRRERFVREGALLARLHGVPGIVRVHGAGAHGDLLWLCMEHVDGHDLAHVLRERGRFAWAEAARLVRGVALGLAAAHERGVVHRDVKPANVILDETGAGALVDFGIAQATDLERLTRTGATVGTPVYFSPEQVGGRPLDGRTDVYSLGVLLFELLTGELPFADDLSLPALFSAILGQQPPPPSALAPDVPAALDGAVLLALTKAPEQRPDARAFAAALDAVLGGSDPPGATPRRARVVLAGVVLAGVMLAIVGALALASADGPAPAPAPPVAVVVEPAPPIAPTVVAIPEESPRVRELRRAWAGEFPRAVERLLAHLAAVRAVSDPPLVDAVPARERGRAALLEGEVLLELGWVDSAARAFARGLDLVGPEPGALLQLARARARLLDGEAALAAADDALARAGPGARVVAQALRAEALALAGRDAEARQALEAARAEDTGSAPPELARAEARVALWGASDATAPLADTSADVAAALVAEGEAELRAAAPIDPAAVVAYDPTDSPGLRRAARAFALAVASAADGAGRGRAWAGLCRARLLRGDVDGAAVAAERATVAAPDAWASSQGRALVRAVRRVPGAAEELVQALEAVGKDPTLRLYDRGVRLIATAVEGSWALRAAPAGAAAVLDRAEALLAAERFPLTLREQLLVAAIRLDQRGPRVDDLERRLRLLGEVRAEDRLLAQRASEGSMSLSADDADLAQLIARNPADPRLYEELHMRGAEIQAWGYDCLALSFELRPGAIPQRGNAQREHNREDPVARAMTAQALRVVLSPHDLSPPVLVVPRDPDQRCSSGVLFAREVELELPLAQVLEAKAAAERVVARQPASTSGWLTLGYLRLDLGDFGGALVALDRAAALHPPFEPRRPLDACWAHLYAALAHGGLREWTAAEAAVRRSAELGLWCVTRLADPRLSPDRSATMLSALEPLARRVKENDVELRRRAQRGR